MKKKKDKHDNDYYWKKEKKNQIWHLTSIEKNDQISVWIFKKKMGGGL